ncbi:MAG: GDP-mannose 4,6-dehydratase [Armatimonadetes bacterium]|nr:GDP-mannose 4,6-dehydratase [Armatimonadota bacterium]
MKILVTGGAGFIGSNVAERMLADGHSVAVLDNLSTGSRENLIEGVAFHEADITDAEAIRRIFEAEQPEVVIHHAAQIDVRRSTRDPQFDARVNVIGSINLLEAAKESGMKKFIYASTGGAIYGEPDYVPADEKHPIQPISQYGISKHTVEHYLFLYGQNFNLPWTVLRYANIYGPRQTPHGEAGVVAIFAGLLLAGKQPMIFGKGNKTRDYCFVGDIVEGNVQALTKGEGEIINLGTGVPTTDQEVFDAVRDAVGASDIEPIYTEERVGEVRHIHLDASKAKATLGWEAKVNFREGVERSVGFYREYFRTHPQK